MSMCTYHVLSEQTASAAQRNLLRLKPTNKTVSRSMLIEYDLGVCLSLFDRTGTCGMVWFVYYEIKTRHHNMTIVNEISERNQI